MAALLIEPLWNGNSRTDGVGGIVAAPSNRTIVEWKQIAGCVNCVKHQASNRTIVEWKRYGFAYQFFELLTLLIEPLWNGNNESDGAFVGGEMPSNRTIVEWKQKRRHRGRRPFRPSNRTIVEWKLGRSDGGDNRRHAF